MRCVVIITTREKKEINENKNVVVVEDLRENRVKFVEIKISNQIERKKNILMFL